MVEQDLMETAVIEKEKQSEEAIPKVAYSETIYNVKGHRELTMEERVQFKAIDIMVDALSEEPEIEGIFGGLTLANSARLTDENDPNYKKDLLWHIHTPEEFFEKVLDEASEESKDGGLLNRWEERMRDFARPNMPRDNDVPDQARAKKLVRDFLARPTSKEAIVSGSVNGVTLKFPS